MSCTTSDLKYEQSNKNHQILTGSMLQDERKLFCHNVGNQEKLTEKNN